MVINKESDFMRYIKLLLLGVTLVSTFSFSSCNMNKSSNNTPNSNSSVEYSFDEEGIVSCVIRQDFILMMFIML